MKLFGQHYVRPLFVPSFVAYIFGIRLISFNSCRFDQFSVSPLSLKGIKDAGYEKMTVVQEATLPVILKGLFSLQFRGQPSKKQIYIMWTCLLLPD